VQSLRFYAIFTFLWIALASACRVLPAQTQMVQTQIGISLSGRVTDSSGAVIPEAIVSVKPVRGVQTSVEVRTDVEGSFTFSGLGQGAYTVTIARPGFTKLTQLVQLDSATPANIPFVLRVDQLRQDVTVTAQSLLLTEAPQGQTDQTIVAREEYKNSPAFSLQNILPVVPGVTILSGNGPRDSSVSIRGSNNRFAFGLRNIQVFEDGFPVTQPDGLARADLTDPHAYGGIDVIQGPSSALYGNDAIEGAINFRTRTGADIHGLDIGADFGSFGYLNDYAAFGGETDRAQYSLFGSNVRSNGFTENTDFNTTTGNMLLGFLLSPHDRIQVKFIDNELNAHLAIRLSLNQYQQNPYQQNCASLAAAGCGSVNLFANGINGTIIPTSAKQAGLGRFDRRTIAGARWEHDLTAQTLLRTQIVFDNKNFNQPQTSQTTRGEFPSFNLRSELTRNGLLWGRQSTSYAAVFYTYENTNQLTYNLTPVGNATLGALAQSIYGAQFNTGFRLREELNLTSRLLFTGGLGYEYAGMEAREANYNYPVGANSSITNIDANRVFINVAPDASLQYRVTDAFRLHTHLGTGYGTPQISNLFTTPQGVFGNNTQLTTQRNTGIDVGGDWTPRKGVQLGLTGFYEWYHNEMVTQSAGASLQSFTYNVPASIHRGVEASVEWRDMIPALRGMRFRASYLYDNQEYRNYAEVLSAGLLSATFNRDGHSIPGVIPNFLESRIDYDRPSGRVRGWGGYFETSFRDPYFLDNANLAKAPGSTVMNLNIHYNPPPEMKRLSRLSFYFELQNLQNRTYVATASNVSDTINSVTGQQNGAAGIAATTGSIYAGMPRTSYGGVKIHF
jgi:iron complex outermembrane recepter protein